MAKDKSSKQAAESVVETKSGEEQDAGGPCRLPGGPGWKVRTKDGEAVGLEWSHAVHVPLRKCDYRTPIIAREYPFRPDSREDELGFGLAAALLLYVPVWRAFARWPIIEVNGIRGHRATAAAYAEVRRLLAGYGYSEKDFEQATWADIELLLRDGTCRRDAAESLREGAGSNGAETPDGSGPAGKSPIVTRVVVQRYEVSSRTLRRHMAEGKLHSRRSHDKGQHSFDEADLDRLYTRRP